MEIQYNVSLKQYNTFGIDVKAKRLVIVDSIYQLQQLLKKEQDVLFIGGGSNILLTKSVDRLVVVLNIKGISIDNQDDNHVYLTVNAGENWHEFVIWAITQNYGGIENLSLIPGNVGTCPIQNIGAYGVEVKDVITKVEAVCLNTQKLVSFSNEACEFGYRDSIFKNKVKGKYCITSVSFKLTKNNHQLNISYGAIEAELKSRSIISPDLKAVSDAIVAIRSLKLPDPRKIGNSGSFFKNPVISSEHYKFLVQKYESMPCYPVSTDSVKVPAGWLIEQSGFKGKNFGTYGVHDKQSLVLVNFGGADGKEIYKLAQTIQKTVKDNFDIDLEIEVNVIF